MDAVNFSLHEVVRNIILDTTGSGVVLYCFRAPLSEVNRLVWRAVG